MISYEPLWKTMKQKKVTSYQLEKQGFSRATYHLNILAARNRKSGNLEIRVPVLGNRLFCAQLQFHFYGNICQGLATFVVRSSPLQIFL